MRCWNAPTTCRSRSPSSTYRPLTHVTPPDWCQWCGASREELAWNGAAWWCNECYRAQLGDEIVSEVSAAARMAHITAGVTFPVAPVDEFYAKETALYRVPAASNRPWMLRHARPKPVNRPAGRPWRG